MPIVLRELRDGDVEVLDALQRDEAVTRMAAVTARSSADFRAHLEKIRASPDVVFRVIELDGEVAGTMGSFVRGDRQLGYLIAPKFWGRGVATRALELLLAIDRQRPMFAHVAVHNVGSRRVLEKCGFRVVERRHEDDGVEVDVLRLG